MDLSPPDVRYFLEIARTQNISRASERLAVSQPALSLALKRLELQLGTPLLIRSKTGISLTRSGQKLAANANEILRAWDGLRKSVLDTDNEVGGSYKLGCHASVALYSLPPLLAEILTEFPRLELTLSHDLSRKLTEDVVSAKLDFALAVNPIRHNELVIEGLGYDAVSFWRCSEPTKSEALLDPYSEQGVLICDPDLLQSQWLSRQCAKLGWHFTRTVTSSSLELIASLTAQGAGVGIIPARVAGLQKRPALVAMGGEDLSYRDHICLIYRADRHLNKGSRTLMAALKRHFHALFKQV